MSAHSRLTELVEQAREFQPRFVVAANEPLAADFDWSGLPSSTQLLVGEPALSEIASHAEIDTVVAAIAGSRWPAQYVGRSGCWERIALANKEAMVVAGAFINAKAAESKAQIFARGQRAQCDLQALGAGRREDLHKIVLTASGGPFRTFTSEQLSQVTVEQALEHPTWDMGPKITIDSATMMNKALEIVEARWLFDVSAEQIEVLVHPQSIIHSLVEFVDGSVVAQMSPPDMKLPIQYALSYPERWSTTTVPWDRSQVTTLTLEPPDHDRFPAVQLGIEVARKGGTAGVVMNAANEAAVTEFVAGRLRFTEIVPACRAVLEHHQFDPQPTLEKLLELDQWARAEVTRWVCT